MRRKAIRGAGLDKAGYSEKWWDALRTVVRIQGHVFMPKVGGLEIIETGTAAQVNLHLHVLGLEQFGEGVFLVFIDRATQPEALNAAQFHADLGGIKFCAAIANRSNDAAPVGIAAVDGGFYQL